MPTTALGTRGPVVSRVELGLAALGRPAYITSGRQEDLPDRSVAGMRTRTFSMLDAAYAAGVDPANAQENSNATNKRWGPFRGQVQATRGYAGMSLQLVVRLSPRSYAIWAAPLWTCLTAPRIIGAARWIDRLTRCAGP